MRHGHIARSVALVAIGAGLACCAEGSWIHVKATVAQALISSAWVRKQGDQRAARPWPWADTEPLARLTVGERADSPSFIVLEGSTGRNLAFGPAHDPASVAPGDTGNSVIAGHRDTHFAVLRNARVGDTLRLETLNGRRLRFQVVDARVADSHEQRIVLSADHPRLTLVTCFPFDAVMPGGAQRWVVTADLMPQHAATVP